MPGGREEPRVAGLQLDEGLGSGGGGLHRVMKAADVGLQSEATTSICARERLIGRGRLRVNAEGIPYVLDSEDEDSDVEVLANVDPIYHDIFVSMYKVLVPIFFSP